MVFDTTAANTGRFGGACSLIEDRLGRQLLRFACRHHIHEIILASVFKTSCGSTSGRDVLLFKRFQEKWSFIDQSAFQDRSTWPQVNQILENSHVDVTRVLNYAMKAVDEKHPRDDYRELLELVILFLGGQVRCGFRFRALGALHHSRWFSKAIYSLKLWPFRNEFQLSAKEERGVRDVSLFCALVWSALV